VKSSPPHEVTWSEYYSHMHMDMHTHTLTLTQPHMHTSLRKACDNIYLETHFAGMTTLIVIPSKSLQYILETVRGWRSLGSKA